MLSAVTREALLTTINGTIEEVHRPMYMYNGSGLEQKLIVKAYTQGYEHATLLIVLLRNLFASPDLLYKQGDPITVRGTYHMHYSRESLPVLIPDRLTAGFVRYNGKILR